MYTLVLVVIIGLLIGSFLNVCIYRLPRGESINWPPSHCPNCKERLKPVDLVPVLSYLFLQGHCRTCKTKISMVYPAIELLNGLLYFAIYSVYGLTPMMGVMAVVTSVLIVVTMIDLATMEIPDELNLVIFIMGCVALSIKGIQLHWQNHLLGFGVGFGFFLFLAIVSRGNMGFGDVKLMGALGWLLGWKLAIEVTMLAFVIGSIGSLALIIMKIKGRKDHIPFGPFIALAAVIAMLWGDKLINLYLQWTIGL